jgi:pentatricopeptide repeat protein
MATPEQVAQRFNKYQEANVISSPAQRIGAMILDASKNDLEFSTRYLLEWMNDPTREPPDVVAVGTVLQAHASSNPEQAEIFWNQILQQLDRLEPNHFWYTSMVSGWAKQGNTTKALEWLERMQQKFQPDLATWNSVLTAWAKSSTADPAQAESILEHMHTLHQQGQLTQCPDVVSYSIVLDAWAQHAGTNPKAAQRAQQLLERMDTPNHISYNTVIHAFTRAGNPHQAEQLVTRMMEQNISPDDVTISVLLSGWSRIGTMEAAERAEQILQKLMPQLGIQPSVVTYSACLACWAKVKHPIAMQRAQALFDQLVQQEHSTSTGAVILKPDVVAYTNLMHVYARHGKAERVEALLHDLLQAYDQSKDPNLQPNIHTFSVVVSAWSRRSVERAQDWLSRMRQYGVEPNVVTYTTVLNAWSKQAAKDPSAPKRAHEILKQMTCPPNHRSFTAVIRAYAEQGRAKEAQALLEEMLHQGPTPDVYTFGAVLYAWSKANPPLEAAKHAEQLLMQMPQLYQQAPNVVCFGNVLVCWSRVHQGADRAEAILRTMKQYGVEPNLFCINIVLNALAKQSQMDNTAVQRALTLLVECRQLFHLIPDEYTYRAVFKAILASSLPNRKELALQLLQEMKQQGISVIAYYTDRLKSLANK